MSGLTVSSADGVARVVFDRPDVLNALSPSVLTELVDACAEIARDDGIKVVRFEGSGNAFSAGADLPAFVALLGGPDAHSIADLGRRATNAIAELPQITIAGIRGHCVGGGLVLAAACDVRIAANDARFMIPELDAGIPLGWGGMAWVVRLVGESLAADLVLSCRPFGADEALQAGLISRVLPPGQLEDELRSFERSVVAKATKVLRVTKRQLLEIRSGTFDARSDAEALLEALKDPESMQQGMQYVAKRLRKP
ncbi:MAG: enoyl-CoA hydratase/isomerase family protein [Polyangiales bacterium]|jgi:enoyl-CoA hydratase/carnithine racemase